MNNRVWNIIMGLNICLHSGDSQAWLSHGRVEGTMTSCITLETLDVKLPNECCVVAELTRSSEGVSKCKKKHTRKHTQIPFYLRPRDGTSRYVCASLRLLCTHCYTNYILHVIAATLSSFQFLIKKKKQQQKNRFVWLSKIYIKPMILEETGCFGSFNSEMKEVDNKLSHLFRNSNSP